MVTLQVYDKPTCCLTGVCSPQVDPVLPRFAADLTWLLTQGVSVERFNLAMQPQDFVLLPDVKTAMQKGYEQALPLVRVNEKIVSMGQYPSREQLAAWCGLGATTALPMYDPQENGCCPGGCC